MLRKSIYCWWRLSSTNGCLSAIAFSGWMLVLCAKGTLGYLQLHRLTSLLFSSVIPFLAAISACLWGRIISSFSLLLVRPANPPGGWFSIHWLRCSGRLVLCRAVKYEQPTSKVALTQGLMRFLVSWPLLSLRLMFGLNSWFQPRAAVAFDSPPPLKVTVQLLRIMFTGNFGFLRSSVSPILKA